MRERIEPVGESRRFGPGIGFNWFDYLGMGGSYAQPPEYYPLVDGCYPPLEDQASWKLILGELDRLRPGFIRFGIPPDPHVDEHGRIVTDTVHLRRLDLVARWAASRGCTVLLDTFLLPARHERPRAAGDRLPWDGGMYQLGAADNRTYAREFVAPFLRVARGASPSGPRRSAPSTTAGASATPRGPRRSRRRSPWPRRSCAPSTWASTHSRSGAS